MSARDRLAKADELFEEALSVPLTGDDAPPEPEATRLVMLLAALVAMTGANAAAGIEANEHRQLSFRVEHPSETRGA